MSLDLNVSRIRNTVTFDVDKVSMKAAKDSIKEVEKFAESLQPTLKVDKIKQQLNEMTKEFEKFQKGVNNTPISPKVVPPKTTDKPAPKSSTSGAGNSNTGSADEKKRQARLDTASVARDRFSFQAGRFRNVGQSDIDSSHIRVNEVTRAFEAGEVSARRMNSVLTRELATLRDIGKQNAAVMNSNYKMSRWRMSELVREGRERERQQKREEAALRRQEGIVERTQERRRERLTEGALGLNPRMLMAGLGIGAAVEGISRIVEGLNSTAERINFISQGARNVEADPNMINAFVRYGQSHGIDSSRTGKAIDNLKDVRERLASSVESASLNKQGKWTGGDAGIDQIMNTFGWTPQMLRGWEHNPAGFLQATVNEGQRRGMTSAEIGHLVENLGDDLMHFLPMFVNGGQAIVDIFKQMAAEGNLLTENQSDAAQRYVQIQAKLKSVEEGMGNRVLESFVNTLATSGGNFDKNVQAMDRAATRAGEVLGKIANDVVGLGSAFLGLSDWISEHFPHKANTTDNTGTGTALSPEKQYQEGRDLYGYLNDTGNQSGWGGLSDFMDMLKNTSFTDQTRGNLLMGLAPVDSQYSFLSSAFNNPNAGYQNQLPTINANVVIPDSALQVNVVPDGSRFDNLFSAYTSQSQQSYSDQISLDLMSSTSLRD